MNRPPVEYIRSTSINPSTLPPPPNTSTPARAPIPAQSFYANPAPRAAAPASASLPTTTVPISNSSASLALPTAGASTSTAAGTTAPKEKEKGGKGSRGYMKGSLAPALRPMMYAFGDDPNPASDTVAVLEEIVVEYIQQLTSTAVRAQGKPRLTEDALRRALDRPSDAKKLGRLNELMYHQKSISQAKKLFDP